MRPPPDPASKPMCYAQVSSTSRSISPGLAAAWQCDYEFRECAWVCIDIDTGRQRCFTNDIVGQPTAQSPVPSPGGLVVKKGSNIFSLMSGGIPTPLSSDTNFNGFC